MTKKQSYIVTSCQISNSRKLISVLNLGYLPAVNQMKKINTLFSQDTFYPAELFYCKDSHLFQIGFVVDKKIIFPKSYPYTSSTTKILRDNFFKLFQKCKRSFGIEKNDLVIDIGSNDGNLLNNFKNHSRVLGITPENIGKIAIKKGINTILRYFDNETAKYVVKNYGKAKIITATNVYAHIDNPNLLTKNIIKCLDNKGIFISESHYIMQLIKKLQYDTIYHEHLRYYSLQSLIYLLNKNNLEVFDAEQIPTHGGSIRVYAARPGLYKVKKNINKIIKLEKKNLNLNEISKFKYKVALSKLKLLKIIYEIKKNKKNIYGVGAPSRASTLINYIGLDESILDCVVEISGSHKIGNYMPGTKLPILNEKKIFENKPDYLLILSWHIADELISNLKKRGFKGKFIIPLPDPKII